MRIVELRRHAERGDNDDLTTRGIEQCLTAKRTLEFPYDAYVVSPAKRAKLTMKAFGGDPALEERRLAPRLRPPFEPFLRRHEELVASGMDAVTSWYAIPDASRALSEVGDAALGAVLEIAAKLREDGRALAVSHGGTIEPLAVAALGRFYGAIFGNQQLAYCEGVKVHVTDDRVARLDVIRLPR